MHATILSERMQSSIAQALKVLPTLLRSGLY